MKKYGDDTFEEFNRKWAEGTRDSLARAGLCGGRLHFYGNEESGPCAHRKKKTEPAPAGRSRNKPASSAKKKDGVPTAEELFG